MPESPSTTEQKLDLILKYIKSARRWAMFRGLITFTFFLVFIVLPIIGGFYLFNYFKSEAGSERFKAIQGQFEEFRNLDFESLGDVMKKLPGR